MTDLDRRSLRWHPATGARPGGPGHDAEVVDLATERAIRLLVRAGLVAPSTAARRKGPVR